MNVSQHQNNVQDSVYKHNQQSLLILRNNFTDIFQRTDQRKIKKINQIHMKKESTLTGHWLSLKVELNVKHQVGPNNKSLCH